MASRVGGASSCITETTLAAELKPLGQLQYYSYTSCVPAVFFVLLKQALKLAASVIQNIQLSALDEKWNFLIEEMCMTGLNFRHISFFYRKFGPVTYQTCAASI